MLKHGNFWALGYGFHDGTLYIIHSDVFILDKVLQQSYY